MLLAEALSLNVVGASAKKLREKGEAVKEKDKDKRIEELAVIYEAQNLARERAEAKKRLSEQPSASSG
jgi:phage terminase Nu1 subunit (DNA packaging protein)